MKKVMCFTAVFVMAGSIAQGKAEQKKEEVRKPASEAECLANNKKLAQAVIDNAAKRLDYKAAEVSLVSVSATSERFVYSSSIYKGEYHVIVKTDTGCFPEEVELVDLATK